MFFKKQKKKQQEVTIEENTQIFIEDFKKLVNEGKKESVRSVIKFMANSIQSELLTKCMYNDRNYQEIDYMRAILNSFLLDLSIYPPPTERRTPHSFAADCAAKQSASFIPRKNKAFTRLLACF